jgi:hypothetical protein
LQAEPDFFSHSLHRFGLRPNFRSDAIEVLVATDLD